MFILGLLLLLLAILFAAYALLGAGSDVTLDAFNISTTMPAATLFLAGMATLLAAGLGLWLMTAGTRRAARKRKERKELERDAREARIHREQAAAPVDRDLRDERMVQDDRMVREDRMVRDERAYDARDDRALDGRPVHDDRTLRTGEPLRDDRDLHADGTRRDGLLPDEDPYPRRDR